MSAADDAKRIGIDGTIGISCPGAVGVEGPAHVNDRVRDAAPDLLTACRAALAYDEAIESCGNDPDRMASFCTAQGEGLDELYFDWTAKARAAVAKATAS